MTDRRKRFVEVDGRIVDTDRGDPPLSKSEIVNGLNGLWDRLCDSRSYRVQLQSQLNELDYATLIEERDTARRERDRADAQLRRIASVLSEDLR